MKGLHDNTKNENPRTSEAVLCNREINVSHQSGK